MKTVEENIGYLLAKQEEQKSDLVRVEQKVDSLTELVSTKFATAETVFKVIKFLGIVVVAVATLQFGDIAKWFNYFFK
jgi:hypothetical protein